MELQPDLSQLLVNRSNETLDIGIARTFCGVQLILNHIIGVMLQIFQT